MQQFKGPLERVLFLCYSPMIWFAAKALLILSVGVVTLGTVQALINCDSAIQAAYKYNRLN